MSDGYDFFAGGAAPVRPAGATARPGVPAAAPGAPVVPGDWQTSQFAPSPYAGYTGAAPAAPGYAPTAPGYAPAPAWPGAQPPSGPAFQQVPEKPRGLLAAIVAGGVAVALGIGAFMFLTRSDSIRLPGSLGGFEAQKHLPSSVQDVFKAMEKNLGSKDLHDVTERLYGDPAGTDGLFVVAAHASGDLGSMDNAVAELQAGAQASALRGMTSGYVNSGLDSFFCLSEQGLSPAGTMCVWWDSRSFLFGYAIGLDAQSTADALAETKAYAGLK